MDKNIKERIKKLQALAERGVGGEKTTAEKKLAKLLEQNHINSLEELDEEKKNYYIFKYNGKHERKLLYQCIYKVMGAGDHTKVYRPEGMRQKIAIFCTEMQRLEIILEFDFYRELFYEELNIFMDAFIRAQHIFPADATVVFDDSLETKRELEMARSIKVKRRNILIEQKNR